MHRLFYVNTRVIGQILVYEFGSFTYVIIDYRILYSSCVIVAKQPKIKTVAVALVVTLLNFIPLFLFPGTVIENFGNMV